MSISDARIAEIEAAHADIPLGAPMPTTVGVLVRAIPELLAENAALRAVEQAARVFVDELGEPDADETAHSVLIAALADARLAGKESDE